MIFVESMFEVKIPHTITRIYTLAMIMSIGFIAIIPCNYNFNQIPIREFMEIGNGVVLILVIQFCPHINKGSGRNPLVFRE